MFKIKILPSAVKELNAFTDIEISFIRAKILDLKHFPNVKNCKKIKGGKVFFRSKERRFRIIFVLSKEENIITITHICLRNEKTYRNL